MEPYQTEKVVLVIVDGLRYADGLGDSTRQFVPKMDALSKRGAIVEPFRNDGHTNTRRAIPAIWCGAWTEVLPFRDSKCGGSPNSRCELPTIFEYYRKQLRRSEKDCIYVLPDVGCPWKASLDSEYGKKYWPLYHSVGKSDMDVWRESKMMLSEHHPTFAVLYFDRVDHFGHSGSWSYYTRAIELADSIVGMVWEFIESDSVYAGKTTMFVTNDHGRHTHDFSGHDCPCEGCRTIQLLAIGPDIKEGYVSTTPRTLCDIVPTIGELMGFCPEKATGSPMLELLKQPMIPDADAGSTQAN
jgi:arylsulfatase A-like enzyme